MASDLLKETKKIGRAFGVSSYYALKSLLINFSIALINFNAILVLGFYSIFVFFAYITKNLIYRPNWPNIILALASPLIFIVLIGAMIGMEAISLLALAVISVIDCVRAIIDGARDGYNGVLRDLFATLPFSMALQNRLFFYSNNQFALLLEACNSLLWGPGTTTPEAPPSPVAINRSDESYFDSIFWPKLNRKMSKSRWRLLTPTDITLAQTASVLAPAEKNALKQETQSKAKRRQEEQYRREHPAERISTALKSAHDKLKLSADLTTYKQLTAKLQQLDTYLAKLKNDASKDELEEVEVDDELLPSTSLKPEKQPAPVLICKQYQMSTYLFWNQWKIVPGTTRISCYDNIKQLTLGWSYKHTQFQDDLENPAPYVHKKNNISISSPTRYCITIYKNLTDSQELEELSNSIRDRTRAYQRLNEGYSILRFFQAASSCFSSENNEPNEEEIAPSQLEKDLLDTKENAPSTF